MVNQKSIHVISRKGRWALVKKGAARALKIYEVKEDAIREGRKYLAQGYDLFVHRTSGMVDFWKKAPDHLRQVA